MPKNALRTLWLLRDESITFVSIMVNSLTNAFIELFAHSFAYFDIWIFTVYNHICKVAKKSMIHNYTCRFKINKNKTKKNQKPHPFYKYLKILQLLYNIIVIMILSEVGE